MRQTRSTRARAFQGVRSVRKHGYLYSRQFEKTIFLLLKSSEERRLQARRSHTAFTDITINSAAQGSETTIDRTGRPRATRRISPYHATPTAREAQQYRETREIRQIGIFFLLPLSGSVLRVTENGLTACADGMLAQQKPAPCVCSALLTRYTAPFPPFALPSHQERRRRM
ncbi:hypothetical protein VTK26DRAFT_5421 [Humicola hyalothermophila]